MALKAGQVMGNGTWDDDASLGAIMEQKFSALSFRQPDPETGTMSEADMEYNKKIAFQAQAEAIIQHIVENMEITGATVTGSVAAEITMDTEPAQADGHVHEVNIPAAGNEVTFTLDGGGVGRVS